MKWKEYDDTVKLGVIKKANCTPPHWNISLGYQICASKEKMKDARIPGSPFKVASPTFLEKFDPPCEGVRAATLNTLIERPKRSSSFVLTERVASATLAFHFKNEQYTEIVYTRAFGFEAFVSNVAAYIGLFLGFAFWQLPDAFKFLMAKFRNHIGGKDHHTFFILDRSFETGM